MVSKIVIRPAGVSEREYLEALQTRASLSNPRDREALLAHPDAIELPVSQIEAGQVLVAEQDGTVAGFAAILSRLRDLEPVEPVVRYEHEHPGDLIHIDSKKLARIERPSHRVSRFDRAAAICSKHPVHAGSA